MFRCSRTLFNRNRQLVTSTFSRSIYSRGSKSSESSPFQSFAFKALLLTGVVGGVGVIIFESMKKKKDETYKLKTVGTAAIGGPFSLVDHNGQARSDLSYLDRFRLVYFGFTFCPDICPTELTKMGRVLEGLEENGLIGRLAPMMISVDPWRDTVGQIRQYVHQFHPKIIGLTGTPEQVMEACKSYRIYASKPPDDGEEDYLVDHSVFMFLMDTEGHYVAHYGPDKDEDYILEDITKQIMDYDIANGPSDSVFSSLSSFFTRMTKE